MQFTENFIAALVSGIGTVLASLITAFIWQFRKVSTDVQQIKTDCAVMKTQICEALKLREDVKKDHDNIIRLEEKTAKNKQDIDALHETKRDILKQLSSKH